MWRYPLAGLVALTATLSSSCSATVDGRAAWQIAPESLRSPAPANSAQPQLSVSDRGVLLSWIERAGIDRSGKRSPAVTIAGIAGNRTSGYPRAAMARGELVFAWTESADGGALQVRTATAALPAAGATAR